jgi:hypothetical protein
MLVTVVQINCVQCKLAGKRRDAAVHAWHFGSKEASRGAFT